MREEVREKVENHFLMMNEDPSDTEIDDAVDTVLEFLNDKELFIPIVIKSLFSAFNYQ